MSSYVPIKRCPTNSAPAFGVRARQRRFQQVPRTALSAALKVPPAASLPIPQSELANRRKGDKENVAIAARQRRETTMTLKWLAERVTMRTWTNLFNLLGAGNNPGRRKHRATVKSENRPLFAYQFDPTTGTLRPPTEEGIHDASMDVASGATLALGAPKLLEGAYGLGAAAFTSAGREGIALAVSQMRNNAMKAIQKCRSSLGVDAEGPALSYDSIQLQSKFNHASGFGVNGANNSLGRAEFQKALECHAADPNSLKIWGTYRGDPVLHIFNPQTELNSMYYWNGQWLRACFENGNFI